MNHRFWTWSLPGQLQLNTTQFFYVFNLFIFFVDFISIILFCQFLHPSHFFCTMKHANYFHPWFINVFLCGPRTCLSWNELMFTRNNGDLANWLQKCVWADTRFYYIYHDKFTLTPKTEEFDCMTFCVSVMYKYDTMIALSTALAKCHPCRLLVNKISRT